MRTLSVSLAALLFFAGAANATPITLTGTSTVKTTDPSDVVTVVNQMTTFTFSLNNIGDTYTQTALYVTPDPGNGKHNYTFTVTDAFAFGLLGTESPADLGTGTLGVTKSQGNNYDISSGGLTWADGTTGTNISLTDGYVVNVALSSPSFVGASPNGGDTETVSATFTLVSGPTAVPEPGTMALLGAGLIGLGIARRRAKA